MREKPCKILRLNLTTYHGFQWEPGKLVKTSGEEGLCGPGWIHYYRHPLLAILHNPVYGDFKKPYLLYTVEVEGEIKHDGWLKSGCTRLTLIELIEIPTVTIKQLVRYAIGCAHVVYSQPSWLEWADRWIDGTDRSAHAAFVEARAAFIEVRAADVGASAADAGGSAAFEAFEASVASAAFAARAAAAAFAAEGAAELPLLEIAEWAME